MFGFGKAGLKEKLEVAVGLAETRALRVEELVAELVAKDEEAAKLTEKVRNLRAAEGRHMQAMAKQVRETEEAARAVTVLSTQLQGKVDQATHYREVLTEIRDMVTPHCAGIGKRMARKAEAALQLYASVSEEVA